MVLICRASWGLDRPDSHFFLLGAHASGSMVLWCELRRVWKLSLPVSFS